MRKALPLLAAVTAATLLRLPLWMLPGPGRDEAAYAYWAWHPQPFYAPLLQILLRGFQWLPLPGLLQLRLPSLLGGIAVLLLVDLRLRRQKAPAEARWLVLSAVALCQWQTWTGSVLHPDTLLLSSLLAAMIAAQGRRVLGFAVAMALAALAKPTGILLLPVAFLLMGRIDPKGSGRRTVLGRMLLVLTVLPLAWNLDRPMIQAMSEFGRVDPATAWGWRILGGLVAIVVTGGPLLLVLAGAGLRQRLARLREDRSDREALAATAIASVLLVVFSAAAVIHGQIKPNWVLPAAVVLLPARLPAVVDPRRRGGRALALFLLAVGLTASGITAIAHHHPGAFAPLEHTARCAWTIPAWPGAGNRESLPPTPGGSDSVNSAISDRSSMRSTKPGRIFRDRRPSVGS